ncbi:hypothetical protein [Bacillus thuringiensis]
MAATENNQGVLGVAPQAKLPRFIS